ARDCRRAAANASWRLWLKVGRLIDDRFEQLDRGLHVFRRYAGEKPYIPREDQIPAGTGSTDIEPSIVPGIDPLLVHRRLAKVREDFHGAAAAIVLFAGFRKRTSEDVLGPENGLHHLGTAIVDHLRLEAGRVEQLGHLFDGDFRQHAASRGTAGWRPTPTPTTAARARLGSGRHRTEDTRTEDGNRCEKDFCRAHTSGPSVCKSLY